MTSQQKKYKKIVSDIAFYSLIVGIPISIFLLVQKYKFDIQLFFANPNKVQEVQNSITTALEDFVTLTLGIFVEAFPFVVLGVLISVLVQVVIPTEKLIKKMPKNFFLRRMLVSFLGVLMPVCECGNVPVARSLIIRGFSVQEAIIFLLAAPSINIITFIVTWEVFSFNRSVAIWRVIATLIIANVTAFLVVKLISKKAILTKEFKAVCETSVHAPKTLARATEIFRSETWLISRYLVIGAMIAAGVQTFVPRETITSIGSNVFLAVIAMLVLALVISICSSVDSFFALAFVNTFSLGSIFAFLVAGPMVDIKMISIMKTTFTYRTLTVITTSVLIFAFGFGVLFSYVW